MISMKKSKKSVCEALVLVIALSLLFVGCSRTDTISVKADTGDTVEITLNKSGGFKMQKNDDKTFTVTYKGKKCNGSFITSEYFDDASDSILNDDTVKKISSAQSNGRTYILYECDDEYYYMIQPDDSDTGIFLECDSSVEEAQKFFRHLKFNIKK